MTIELIDNEQYNRMVEIQKNHTLLTYQNTGYDYPDKSKWSDDDKKAFEEVQNILKKHIKGFSEFNHFKLDKNNEIRLRFQYDWSADAEIHTISFTGVGYLYLRELHKGFDK